MPLILSLLNKMRQDKSKVILIVPIWPGQAWYPYLRQLYGQPWIKLQTIPHLLSQDRGHMLHPTLVVLRLSSCILDGSQE